MIRLALALAVVPALITGATVKACSPPPLPKKPPTQWELDANEERSFHNAEGLVEVVALSSSTPWGSGTPARARILRAYKGDVRPGSIVEFYPQSPLCPAPQMIAGTRGLTYLSRRDTRWEFRGYLTRADVAELRRRRLIGSRKR